MGTLKGAVMVMAILGLVGCNATTPFEIQNGHSVEYLNLTYGYQTADFVFTAPDGTLIRHITCTDTGKDTPARCFDKH